MVPIRWARSSQKGIRQRRKTFESGLIFLGTLGSNSPFVGLFGTVLGVVAAFKELGAASAAVAATAEAWATS